MQHLRAAVHEHAQAHAAAGHSQHPFAQTQFLAEIPALKQRTTLKVQAQTAELAKAPGFRQRIRARHKQEQIAGRFFHPGVDHHLAVAQRHRTGGILAGTIPSDIHRVHRGGVADAARSLEVVMRHLRHSGGGGERYGKSQ